MRIASLGSGSKGNASILQTENACLMVDCGFNLKQCRLRMEALGISPDALSGILVTHEHSDHIGGVYSLLKNYNIDVYMTQGTALAGNFPESDKINIIDAESDFGIGDIQVHPVVVPHDAREPCQFVFKNKHRSVGVLTDLGVITPHVEERFSECDALLLEFNHDLDMLINGSYPEKVKRRIAGDYGHLNNQQAAELVGAIDLDRIQHLLVAHISEKNNCIESVVSSLNAYAPLLEKERVQFIDQDIGLSWCDLT